MVALSWLVLIAICFIPPVIMHVVSKMSGKKSA